MKIKSLIIFAVLVTAIFGFSIPGIAQGVTIADLMAQIAQLTAQLQAMQAQQGGGTSTAWCHTFNANIGMGQKTGNPEFSALVIALQKQGVLEQATTYQEYDENMASAITEFQEKYASEILAPSNLKHGTGYVGKATRAKLNALYGCGIILPPTCTPNWQCKWGACINGYQQQTPVDLNNCAPISGSSTGACPALAQACTPSTTPSITVISSPTGSVNSGSAAHIVWTSQGISNNVAIGFCPVGEQPQTGIHCTESRTISNIGSADISLTGALNLYVGQWYPVVSGYTGTYGTGTFVYAIGGNFTILSSTQPSITVTSPNGGETWRVGETHNVTWTRGNYPNSIVNIGLQNTKFNSGFVGIAQTVPNTGSYQWKIAFPLVLGGNAFQPDNNYRISVGISDINLPSESDISDNYFTITSAPTTSCTDSDGGRNYFVKGTLNGIYDGSPITLDDFCIDRTNSTNGTIVNQCSGSNCQLGERVCNSTNPTNYGTEYYTCPNGCSNGACVQVTQPKITVTSPNGGESWVRGSTHNITWTATGLSSSSMAAIALWSSGGSPTIIANNIPTNNGSYSWTIPSHLTVGSQYRFQVYETGSSYANTDYSDNYFAITAPQ